MGMEGSRGRQGRRVMTAEGRSMRPIMPMLARLALLLMLVILNRESHAQPIIVGSGSAPSSSGSRTGNSGANNNVPAFVAPPGDRRAFAIKCGNLVTARLDPIVYKNTCADHIHSVFGSVNFGASVTDKDLVQEPAFTTCSSPLDQSMYWVPSLYYRTPETKRLQLVQVRSFSVYYFKTKSAEPFPLNYRAIAGDASRRNEPFTAADPRRFYTEWKCRTKAGPLSLGRNPQSVSWLDLPLTGCDRLLGTIRFPNCFKRDPKKFTGGDGSFAYQGAESVNDKCPDSHPFQVPQIQFNLIWELEDDWNLRNLELSTGDKVGSSMHGDFLAGWDPEVLTDCLTKCSFYFKERVSGYNCPLYEHIGSNQTGRLDVRRTLARSHDIPIESVDDIDEVPLISKSSPCEIPGSLEKEIELRVNPSLGNGETSKSLSAMASRLPTPGEFNGTAAIEFEGSITGSDSNDGASESNELPEGQAASDAVLMINSLNKGLLALLIAVLSCITFI